MKTQAYFILIVVSFFSCDSLGKKNSAIKRFQIGDTDFYISLPEYFRIQVNIGPDFTVYYFLPKDTTNKKDVSGGLYLGNHPSEFKPDNDSCIATKINGKILGKETGFTVYNCNESYFLQATSSVYNKDGSDSGLKIHVFGSAKNGRGVDSILRYFSTLTEKMN